MADEGSDVDFRAESTHTDIGKIGSVSKHGKVEWDKAGSARPSDGECGAASALREQTVYRKNLRPATSSGGSKPSASNTSGNRRLPSCRLDGCSWLFRNRPSYGKGYVLRIRGSLP